MGIAIETVRRIRDDAYANVVITERAALDEIMEGARRYVNKKHEDPNYGENSGDDWSYQDWADCDENNEQMADIARDHADRVNEARAYAARADKVLAEAEEQHLIFHPLSEQFTDAERELFQAQRLITRYQARLQQLIEAAPDQAYLSQKIRKWEGKRDAAIKRAQEAALAMPELRGNVGKLKAIQIAVSEPLADFERRNWREWAATIIAGGRTHGQNYADADAMLQVVDKAVFDHAARVNKERDEKDYIRLVTVPTRTAKFMKANLDKQVAAMEAPRN